MSKLDKAKTGLSIFFDAINVVSWIRDKVRARRKGKYTQAERDQAERETKDLLDRSVKRFQEKQ